MSFEFKIAILVVLGLAFIGFWGPKAQAIVRFPLACLTLALCAFLGMEVIDPFERRRRMEQVVEQREQRKTPPETDVENKERRWPFADISHTDMHGAFAASNMPGGCLTHWGDGSTVVPEVPAEVWKMQKQAERDAAVPR